jgi:hypothetical protein
LRETLLKKESPSNSLPKTFSSIFSARVLPKILWISLFRLLGSTLAEKIKLKVFGKGFGEEPFFRKVCPDERYVFYGKYGHWQRTFSLYII